MNELTLSIRQQAARILSENVVDVVIGFKDGTLPLKAQPAFVTRPEQTETLVHNGFCQNNLASYVTRRSREERVGIIRYLFTERDARGVGVADAMFNHAVGKLRADDIEAFDAVVSPGHREAKNFYEAHGFSARSIIMHSHNPIDD